MPLFPRVAKSICSSFNTLTQSFHLSFDQWMYTVNKRLLNQCQTLCPLRLKRALRSFIAFTGLYGVKVMRYIIDEESLLHLMLPPHLDDFRILLLVLTNKSCGAISNCSPHFLRRDMNCLLHRMMLDEGWKFLLHSNR